MHQRLTPLQIAALDAPAPTATAPAMTRTQKLERWAVLLEKCHYHIALGDRLESMDRVRHEAHFWIGGPIALAAADPVLYDAGLQGQTIGDAKRFFEITDEQVHALSCNCGGAATGQDMAGRVRGFIQPSAGINVSAGLDAPLLTASLAVLICAASLALT